jgi:hypothetical protein
VAERSERNDARRRVLVLWIRMQQRCVRSSFLVCLCGVVCGRGLALELFHSHIRESFQNARKPLYAKTDGSFSHRHTRAPGSGSPCTRDPAIHQLPSRGRHSPCSTDTSLHTSTQPSRLICIRTADTSATSPSPADTQIHIHLHAARNVDDSAAPPHGPWDIA